MVPGTSAALDRAPDVASQGEVMDPGAMLRSARLAAGISIEQIAQRLNLMERVVQAIEANELQQFSALAYLRGYVRAYARHLGIDPEPLLRAYADENTKVAAPPARSHERHIEEGGVRRSGIRSALMAGFFVVLVVLLAWLWPNVERAVSEFGGNALPQNDAASPAIDASDNPPEPLRSPVGSGAESTASLTETLTAPVSENTPMDTNGEGTIGPNQGVPPGRQEAGDTMDSRTGMGGQGSSDETAFAGGFGNLSENREDAPVAGDVANAGDVADVANAGEFADIAEVTEIAMAGVDDQSTSTAATAIAGFDSATPANVASPEARTGAEDEEPAALIVTDGLEGSEVPPEPLDLLRVRRITPTGDEELWFEFSEDCWVEIYDAEGQALLYQDLLRRRQSLRLVGSGPFQIVLGYAPGVTLEYNGETVPLAPHTRNTVASLVVGQ